MDQCVKLGRSIKQDFFNQFSTHLAHCSSKLSPLHRWLLLFEVINSRVKAPSKYIDLILQHPIEINKIYNNKNKYAHFVGKTLLMAACQILNFQAVSALMRQKQIRLDIADEQGRNCLFYALRNQSEEECYNIVRAIISQDPSLVNATNQEGVCLLIQALDKKSLRLVELLLKNSADPNFKCKQSGNTALHKALLNNSDRKKDIILLLLNFKADPSIENKNKKNCFDIAQQVNFQVDWLHQLYKQSQQPAQEGVICHEQLISVTKQDQNSVNEGISSQMSSSEAESQQFTIDRLSTQIENFSKSCEKKHFDSWKDIAHIYEELTKIGEYLNLKIDIIGSYATGLWTSYSDIDIVYTNLEPTYIQIQDMLTRIYEILKPNSRNLGIKDIYINKNTNGNSFPNIKVELDDKRHYRKIDITIFQKKNNGQKYVCYIQQRLHHNSLIKPVFFVLHKLLRTFNLNNPAKNGLKTYAIFLMILINAERFKCINAGHLFVNTIYFYAHCFVYEQQQNGLSRINIYDPLNEYNNVGGRKTDVNRLRQMFKAADYGLRLASGKNILEYLFSLHNIFQI